MWENRVYATRDPHVIISDCYYSIVYLSYLYIFVSFYQAVANESGLNFISVKGPELLNMVSCGISHCLYKEGNDLSNYRVECLHIFETIVKFW